MSGDRLEHDSFGDVLVPDGVRWGPQTQRAVENFPVSGQRIAPELVRALALVKAEAARVNARSSAVPQVTKALGAAIVAAAEEVAGGAHGDEFPVDVYQTGSGTSSNMNVNEVIAHLASERLGRTVHPNDHVNASQSSNDVFPTAIHLAAAAGVTDGLLPALTHLARALRGAQRRHARVVKAGRTHLMDAVPVTLGQELGGYATQVEEAADRVREGLPRLCALPLGGTAVGTGLNAPRGFARAVIAALAARTGLPCTEARDHFAAQGGRDALVECSASLRGLAVALVKIANDLRWMASGPTAGLAEIRLPELQPGSSIMPGKVNPVMPEVVTQVSARVIGNDATVAFAGSQGAFELNTYMPVMAHAVLESIRLLTAATRLLADRCVVGIEADAERCRTFAEASPAIVTALAPHVGYEAAASVVQEARRTGRRVRDVVVARRLLSRAEVEHVLDVEAMTRGGVIR